MKNYKIQERLYKLFRAEERFNFELLNNCPKDCFKSKWIQSKLTETYELIEITKELQNG